jgi:hypothetical protein
MDARRVRYMPIPSNSQVGPREVIALVMGSKPEPPRD